MAGGVERPLPSPPPAAPARGGRAGARTGCGGRSSYAATTPAGHAELDPNTHTHTLSRHTDTGTHASHTQDTEPTGRMDTHTRTYLLYKHNYSNAKSGIHNPNTETHTQPAHTDLS